MNLRILLAMAIAAFSTVPLLAQACPMQKTQDVKMDVFYGPLQTCGGFGWQIGTLQLSLPNNGCPLFVIHTPAHEVAVPSTYETRVVPTGLNVPVTFATFTCSVDWVIIIPVGTACTLDKVLVLYQIPRLKTENCFTGPST